MKVSLEGDSCNISDKGKSCCSTATVMTSEVDLKEHWDKAYENSPEDKLGWYETDLSPMLKLISETELKKSATILSVGAGSTTLVDELLKTGYSNIVANDISEVALKNLENRLGTNEVEFVVDDLTKPKALNNISPVDLWIDRAVLHFFTNEDEQDTYFDLLKSKVKSNGFVILAEYNLSGAEKCAGLPVHRYSKEMLANKLGEEFNLVNSFDYIYIMPSGAERPYIYTIFRKNK